jgi:hypothetical protein
VSALRYSTYLMVGALVFDLVVAVLFFIVALAVRTPSLITGFYAFLGALIFILIGMGASLGLALGSYGKSMLTVSVIFNVVIAALMVIWPPGLASEALTIIVAVVNIAITAMAYPALRSGRTVALPMIDEQGRREGSSSRY